MRRLTMNYRICELLILGMFLPFLGCASIERPDSWVCGVNAKSEKLRCYNLKSDYSDQGTLKPEAKPMIYPLKSVSDLNGWVCIDPKSLEKLKVYLGDLRDYSANHCN
jgi:hypothetical protein